MNEYLTRNKEEDSYLKLLFEIPNIYDIIKKRIFTDIGNMEESMHVLSAIEDHFIEGAGISPYDTDVTVFTFESTKVSSLGILLSNFTDWNVITFNKNTKNSIILENKYKPKKNFLLINTDPIKWLHTNKRFVKEKTLIVAKLDSESNLDYFMEDPILNIEVRYIV
ncbi:MAG: hypothetical protein AABY22_33555, partial [Nanoarchaeota archaeon]